MTDAEINQLRDLLRAATPGPWKNHTHEEDEGSDWATISATPVVARSGYKWTPTVGVCDGGDSVENAKNAALIVAAVNALPSLLDEVERLRDDAARLDFIEKRARYDPKLDGNHAWWPTTFEHVLRGPTLRAAIDAQMHGEQK